MIAISKLSANQASEYYEKNNYYTQKNKNISNKFVHAENIELDPNVHTHCLINKDEK